MQLTEKDRLLLAREHILWEIEEYPNPTLIAEQLLESNRNLLLDNARLKQRNFELWKWGPWLVSGVAANLCASDGGGGLDRGCGCGAGGVLMPVVPESERAGVPSRGTPWFTWKAIELNRLFDTQGRQGAAPANIRPETIRDGERKQ